MTIKVKGMAELLEQLTQLEATLAAKALAKAARKAFAPVLAAAKAMCPKDSGALADSLAIKVEKPSSGDAVVKVGIRIGAGHGAQQRIAAAAFGEAQSLELPPARRWHFVELGTSRSAAHPFLRPALDSEAGTVVGLLKEELRKEIAKALGGKR